MSTWLDLRSYLPSASLSLQHVSGENGRQEPTEHGKTAKFSLRSVTRAYTLDWLLVVFLGLALSLLNRSPGHKREFSLTDISIQHSFAVHERVPPWMLGVVSTIIPLLVLVPIGVFISRNKWDLHNAVLGMSAISVALRIPEASFLGLFMSLSMAGIVTQLIKGSVGRPRPDLIARCLPNIGATDAYMYGLSTVDICTNTNLLILDDGFKSFPSGHSSLSFAGLGFLSCFLAGKMHLYDKRGHRTRAWIALVPCVGAMMVAISRTEDNRHHWQDVLVGSLLGLFIAWLSYRTYFPPLSHRLCHLPLAPLESEEDSDLDRVALLSDEENGAAPRDSEEAVAWRRG
ncbi:diacylglycerol diphosphate phosphatase / phosphatidate phosphatase, partial [Tremellales sp. Uapishka_1]